MRPLGDTVKNYMHTEYGWLYLVSYLLCCKKLGAKIETIKLFMGEGRMKDNKN